MNSIAAWPLYAWLAASQLPARKAFSTCLLNSFHCPSLRVRSKFLTCFSVQPLPIRLTHTPTVSHETSFSVDAFRGRFQSFSSFFPMKRSVLPTWKKLDDGFGPHCHRGDPFRIATRPGVLRCRKCRHDTRPDGWHRHGTQAGAHGFGRLIWSRGQTPGISAVQFQRHYETARHSPQAPRWHGAGIVSAKPNMLRIAMGWFTGCPPQGSRRLCRRGSSETGNRAGQAKGRTLCRACQARRSTLPTRFVGSWRAPLLRGRTGDWSGYASKRGYEHCTLPSAATQRLPRTICRSSPI